MDVSTRALRDLDEGDLDLWREWQYRTPGLESPFLSPDFALAIDRIRDGCFVLVARDDEGTAGFLPLERPHGRVVRAIGMGVSDAQGIVHRPGRPLTVDELVAATSASVFEYDHLVATQLPARAPYARRVGSPAMDLSRGYADYRDARRGLTKSAFSSVERKDRKLARERGELRLEYDSRDPEMLELMMAWKSAHYRRTGAPDLFRHEWARRLVRDSFGAVRPSYAGLMSVLYVGDEPVAVEFGLRSRTQYERWFGGYDTALGAYSPGLVMLLRFAQAAADHGLQRIDLGKGEEGYKQFFASYDLPLAEGWLSRPSGVAAVYHARHAPPSAARAFLRRHPELRKRYRSTANAVNRLRRYGPGASAPAEAG
jgi:CelD/BcsL family acetyltransferase involved in cellulose biosynthesis